MASHDERSVLHSVVLAALRLWLEDEEEKAADLAGADQYAYQAQEDLTARIVEAVMQLRKSPAP
jgi:hypothetical protein